MKAFAAALPLINFAGRDFCEVDRELDRFERRGFRVAVDRAPEALEPFDLRRLRPPLAEPLEARHSAHGSTGLYIRVPHEAGPAGGRFCKSSIAANELSFAAGTTS